MEDRGFNISETLKTYAQLVTPPFTRGKNQSNPGDVHSTRQIVNV